MHLDEKTHIPAFNLISCIVVKNFPKSIIISISLYLSICLYYFILLSHQNIICVQFFVGISFEKGMSANRFWPSASRSAVMVNLLFESQPWASLLFFWYHLTVAVFEWNVFPNFQSLFYTNMIETNQAWPKCDPTQIGLTLHGLLLCLET